jgi:hypothetical protein
MERPVFRKPDLAQLKEEGISLDQARRHLAFFRSPPKPIVLDRPCTAGDGIRLFSETEADRLSAVYEEARQTGRAMKFVPASGAASRMFNCLMAVLKSHPQITREKMAALAARGDENAAEVLRIIDGLHRFAFHESLREDLKQNGANGRQEGLTGIFEFLLGPSGLNSASLPKALLPFHGYPDGPRTALEEHWAESVAYIRDSHGRCRLHFTIAPEHRSLFQSFISRKAPYFEKRCKAKFDIRYSFQDKSTNTLAVDLKNRPFRQSDGRLLFRAGGHGALLSNLGKLRGDLIFIKNIDNVVPEKRQQEICRWKKALGGLLVEIQKEVFDHIKRLSARHQASAVEEAEIFAQRRLLAVVPSGNRRLALSSRRKYILDRLNRPLRVCGVVKNAGEPGGGPFWVKEKTGETSLQIVEAHEVNSRSRRQQAIFSSSTHFNPVDLVCGVRNWKGKPFDLTKYADPDAVFISRKYHEGQEIKALELPGLWNGAMARWNTLFVEVPADTFHPVKTLTDLLREGHQNS